jgi:hypothetical protein
MCGFCFLIGAAFGAFALGLYVVLRSAAGPD